MQQVLSGRANRRIGRAMHLYGMLEQGDRIVIAVSGGVDSLVLTWVLDNWRRKAPINYEILAVHVDIAHENCRPSSAARAVAACLRKLDIQLHILPATLQPSQWKGGEESPNKDICYSCARSRRNQLFEYAREMSCSKVAFGHHRDDIVETFFLNLFYAGNISTMVPRQDIFEGRLALIRPLAFLEKADIKDIAAALGLEPIRTPCPASGRTKRNEIRDFLAEAQQRFPDMGSRVFAALSNVRQDYLLKDERQG